MGHTMTVLQKRFIYLAVGLLTLSAPPLLAIPEFRSIGWILLALSLAASLLVIRTSAGRHVVLLISMLALLGLIPINTDVSYGHFFIMGTLLIATIAIPWAFTHFGLRERVISFPLLHGKWNKKQVAYIGLALVGSYLLLPFYLGQTGSYLNWDVVLEPSYIVRFFIGTNGLGIWDELFFVGVCLALLRHHIPFVWANVAQAILWTAFLYELGFRGWGPIPIFIFALSQGYVFLRSKSILYIVAIHLTIDFVLFLTLIHLHHPEYLRIFITSPF
jgi:membrane protease YdiL (CAAX protease family)